MRYFIITFMIILSLISCKRDNFIPIEPESDIISGTDTLIFGEWKYLHSFGGWGGSLIDKGDSLLILKPVRDFVAISKENKTIEGRMVFRVYENDLTKIIFLQGGTKSVGYPQSIQFNGADTLILNDPCCDMYSDYYKRIK
jgi:hypothetical protein